jgi:hypothetical protein
MDELQRIRDNLRNATAKLKNLQDVQRRRQQKLSCNEMTLRQKTVCLLILMNTNWNTLAAAIWMSSDKQRKIVGDSLPDLVTRYQEIFATWDNDHSKHELQMTVENVAQTSRTRWGKEAENFLRGAHAAQWLKCQNATKGFAPASRHVAGVLSQPALQAPWTPLAPTTPGTRQLMGTLHQDERMTAKQRMQLTRWRRKWHVSLKKIRGKEEMEAPELTEKVLRDPPKKTKVGPKLGAGIRTLFWGASCGR